MRHYRCFVFAAFLLAAGSAPAMAQEREAGLKAGISFASVGGSESDGSYGLRTGLTAGAFAVVRGNSRVALQLEALFTEKGGKQVLHDPNVTQGELSATFKLDYFDLPVLARIRGPRLASARVHFLAGPMVSMRLGAKYQEGFTDSGSFGVNIDIGDDVRRFDLGLVVGAGADIGSHLVVDARYGYGLRNLFDSDTESSLKNRGFAVTAGFRIYRN
jgi:hypothetical protein